MKYLTDLLDISSPRAGGSKESDGEKSIQDLKTCLRIYECILVSEWSPKRYPPPPIEDDSGDENLPGSCDFCEGDIFNALFVCSNLECRSVISYKRDVDICIGCFAEGRSCYCGEMTIHQFRDFKELEALYYRATDILKKVIKSESREKIECAFHF